jgi:hypothetical protein
LAQRPIRFCPHQLSHWRQKISQLQEFIDLLVAVIGLEPGEEVEWELLDRGELHLVRSKLPAGKARDRARRA